MNAVDSENTKNLQSDSWRKHQLMKLTAHASHPYRQFGTGNLRTLYTALPARGQNTRTLMMEFYQMYFSANIMRVCVLGNQSLDCLQEMVCSRFAEVPNKNLSVPAFSPDCIDPVNLGKIIEIVPILDTKTLALHFPIPEIRSKFKSKPTRYY